MSTHVKFTDRSGHEGMVTIDGPGTNFGARISTSEAHRLLSTFGSERLPFTIMAAGYGEDEDWSGLGTEDAEQDLASFESMGWAPFEVLIEQNLDTVVPTWFSDDAYDALAAWATPQRLKSGYDILVEHLGRHTADDIVGDLRANDLDFMYLTCGVCGGDLEAHMWHNDISHTFS